MPSLTSPSITVTATSSEAPAQRHELVILHSPDRRWVGRCVPLDGREIVFGRRPTGDVAMRIRDACLSRNHAILGPSRGTYYAIRDADSKNHCFVDGVQVEQHELQPGSVVRIGHTIMVHRHVPEGAPRPGSSSTAMADAAAGLVGASYAVHALREALRTVARTNVPVLIEGETGVGKDAAARVIHELSRANQPFHPVGCAGLPASGAESALFGTISRPGGEDSDATRGHFHLANGGTLYLDELGALSRDAQPTLLRVLEDSAIRRVGGVEPEAIDVRVIASSNEDLEDLIEAGRFRPDLYARFTDFPIHIPPLRDRPDDVIALAHHFLVMNRSQLRLSADTAEALLLHDWPYNVREVEKLIRRLCLTVEGDRISLRDLPHETAERVKYRGSATHSSETDSRRPSETELRATLQTLGGRVSRVATHFHVHRRVVYRWLALYGLQASAFQNMHDTMAD